MADDIKVTSSSTAGNSAQNAATQGQPNQSPQNKTENSPVIDLRVLGQAGQAASAQTGTGAKTGTPVANQSLEDAAMMAGQNTVAPPDKYAVPDLVKQKFPDLVQLIKETESMNDEERDYWFQILPIMTEDQISKFRDILLNEKKQLAALDKEYNQELGKLNEKHLIEWKEFESKEKRKALGDAEKKAEEEERKAEEDLLSRLSQA